MRRLVLALLVLLSTAAGTHKGSYTLLAKRRRRALAEIEKGRIVKSKNDLGRLAPRRRMETTAQGSSELFVDAAVTPATCVVEASALPPHEPRR